MKKIVSITLLVIIIALLLTGTVSARQAKINIKGEVKSIDGSTLTLETHKGEIYVISAPDFDLSSIQVGDTILVKANAGEDGTWVAEWVKKIGKPSEVGNGDDDDEDDDIPKGSKANSAFCDEGKHEKVHPLATKLVQRFSDVNPGINEAWIMEKYCSGFGLGAIMLALSTSSIDGVAINPDALLAERESGKGWGKIWQELNLIGKEKQGDSPPGHLKRSTHSGPKVK